ncbi:MAG: hypothetical protein HRT87_09385 [Legionellales bacterium]|nr:hypothetical protein [Legionellales bacterium]
MATVGSVISRIRNQVKAETQDAFVTDRYIHSLIIKFALVLMRRQDNMNRLTKFNSIWKSLPYVELIEVDKIEAQCTGISSGCTIKRTKEKLPEMLEGYWGPLIRTVSSIDLSVELQNIQPGTYTSLTKTTTFKYNKKKYFWYLDGYLYFPDLDWDAVRVEALFNDSIAEFQCDADECIPVHEQEMSIPEYLFAEIEQQILAIMTNTIQIPSEDSHNKINPHR